MKINFESKCCEHGSKLHHVSPYDDSVTVCLRCNCSLVHMGDGKLRPIPLTPGQLSMLPHNAGA